MLYQLSYSRERWDNLTEPTTDFYRASTMLTAPACRRLPRRPARVRHRPRTGPGTSGGEGDRTPDLVNAIHALSQLSYAPCYIVAPSGAAAARKPSRRERERQAHPLCRDEDIMGS